MTYRQITSDERYTISLCRADGMTVGQIARFLGRHRSTIHRELSRNRSPDGCYRYSKAQEMTNGRRRRSRRNRRFGAAEIALVERCIRVDWSPEQTAGFLGKERMLRISHETIYRYIWADKASGGGLWRHLRIGSKKIRKRYGKYDSRGRLAGKRHISERPVSAENRSRIGHWESDTLMGSGDQHCVVTLVERKTGYLEIGKLGRRSKEALKQRAVRMIRSQPRRVLTITSDNGTEFHDYQEIEEHTGVKFYFATPYHSWERGTSENTNGLIRQYLPKRVSMAGLTQGDCERIAEKLNKRPRKRLGFRTPLECYDNL